MKIRLLLFFTFLLSVISGADAQDRIEGRCGNFADVAVLKNGQVMRKFLNDNGMSDAFGCSDPVGQEEMMVVMPAAGDVRLELFRMKTDSYGNKVPDYEVSLGRAETAQAMYFVAPRRGCASEVIVEAVDGYGRRAYWNPRRTSIGYPAADEDFAAMVFPPLAPEKGYKSSFTGYNGVKVYIEDGDVIIDIYDIDKYRKVIPLGCDSPMRNGKYRVINTVGECKDIVIGDIGQDTNPYLAILYVDQTVSYMHLYEAINRGVLSCSGRVRGFWDIEKLVCDGAGEWTDDDGTSGFSYRTIYAVDSGGFRYEIKPMDYFSSYFFEHNGHLIMLTDDLSMVYIDYNEGAYKMYLGTFEAVNVGNSTKVFDVEYNLMFEKDLNDPAAVMTKTDFNGKMVVDMSVSSGYKVKTVSGLKFGGDRGEPLFFKML